MGPTSGYHCRTINAPHHRNQSLAAENLHLLGIDSGGTFTDFIYYDGAHLTTCKVLSTPQAPERAILAGIEQLAIAIDRTAIVHGSTVATNAVLEGKGARTAFITSSGFADMLSIGRQRRRQLYALEPEAAPVPVAADLCFEVDARLSAEGDILCRPRREQLAGLQDNIKRSGAEAVAINLLFSFIDGSIEHEIAEHLPAGLFVSCSSNVLAEYREYERGICTWLNAYVGPVIKRYLNELKRQLPNRRISIMQSFGGTSAIDQCSEHGVQLLLSGPAAGLAGARHIAQQCGRPRLLSFDMGGTSTDVALIEDEVQLTNEGRIGPYPVAVAMVDMHTIGAGGGSLAWIDAGGLLQVGPQSAGADPGPACYGKGGRQATITDANLVLGRLPRDMTLAGSLALDYDAAFAAVGQLAAQLHMDIRATAHGIINIAEEHMANALRHISLQRGFDPRQFALVSFGGAGGLHVCALADALQMREAIIPYYAGVLSAFGMLVAPRKKLLSRTLIASVAGDEQRIEEEFRGLETAAIDALREEGIASETVSLLRSVDMRYYGQTATLNVPWRGKRASATLFQQQHQRRYGHRLEHDVELVNIRLEARGPQPSIRLAAPAVATTAGAAAAFPREAAAGQTGVFERCRLSSGSCLHGPAIVCEALTTSYIAAGWQATVDAFGNLLLQKHQGTSD